MLTHPYLMATFAYTGSSSPIHRGVFMARNVLGRTLRPPPDAFTPLAADLHPNLTTRERVALQTRPESCQTCHGMINPLGFTLENFDAIGRFRDRGEGPAHRRDRQLPDAHRRGGARLPGLATWPRFLAGSEEAHDAFVEQLFHHLVKQPVRAFGPQTLPGLRQSFARSEYNIRKLMVEIVADVGADAADETGTTVSDCSKE